MNRRAAAGKHARTSEGTPRKVTVRKARRTSGGMGVLSKALAIMLAVNMAAMLALPFGVFADDIIVGGDGYEVEYGDDSGGAVAEPQDEPAAASESEPGATTVINGGGFQTMDFTTMASTTVFDWLALWDAVNDSSIDVIDIGRSFERDSTTNNQSRGNRLPTISRNLTINGNGFEINFGPNQAAFQFANPVNAATVEINNLVVKRAGSNAANDAFFVAPTSGSNLTLDIKGVRFNGSPIMRMVTSTGNAIIRLGGYDLGNGNWAATEWKQQNITAGNTGGKIGIDAQRLEFGAGPTNITMGATVVRVKSTSGSAYIKVLPGAIVTLENTRTDGANFSNDILNTYGVVTTAGGGEGQCIWFDDIRDGNSFTVEGGTIKGTSHAYAQYGDHAGVFNFNGTPATGFDLTIEKGGEVTAISTGRMAAFVSNTRNCTFYLKDPGSMLTAESEWGYGTYAGTLRFRAQGNQKFYVTNGAELHVTKKFHAAVDLTTNPNRYTFIPAVRFGTGTNNSFFVSDGGKVYIENEGNGNVYDPSTVDANYGGYGAAIEFAAADFTFDVQGEGSLVSLKSASGAAVNSNASGGKILISDRAVFLAEGKTLNANSTPAAIFRVTGGNCEFNMNDPLYYDFRNTSKSGLLFNTGTTSKFISTNSDLSVWTRAAGADHEGNPALAWTRITYELGGANFSRIDRADPDGHFPNHPSGTYAGMQNYSRMSGNNANPKVGPLVEATNADKYIHADAKVPEGQNLVDRGAWDDEVYADIEVTPYDDPSHPITVLAVSLESKDVYRNPNTNVLTEMDGLVRYPDDDNSSGLSFLRPGDTYKITAAWSGDPDKDSPRAHISQANDLIGTPITVVDKTPPAIVTINVINDYDPGTIWTDQRTISGTYEDMSSVAYNRESIDKIYAKVTRGDTTVYASDPDDTILNPTATPKKTWSITLPSDIGTIWQDGDKLSIIAVDTTGNENPVATTTFHDASFPAAASLEVQDFPVELSADNKLIGLSELRALQSGGNAAIITLIDAKATKTGTYTPSTDVSITNSNGILTEINTYQAWINAYGDVSKQYTISYQLDSYPAINKTAIITVIPRENPPDIDSGIAADNITLSVNNAIDFLDNKTQAQQYQYILEESKAVAFDYDVDTGVVTYVLNDVSVTGHGILGVANTIQNPSYPTYFARTSNLSRTAQFKAFVVAGDTPVIYGTNVPINVWTGDPLSTRRPAGSILPDAFNIKSGVTAFDSIEQGATEITDRITWPNTGGLAIGIDGKFTSIPLTGEYTVTYRVENDDSNFVTAQRSILVNIVRDNDYWVDGYDFVATVKEVTAADTTTLKTELVTTLSQAQAGRVRSVTNEPLPIAVPPVVKNLNNLLSTQGEYSIDLGVTAVSPYVGNPIVTVKGIVVARDKIGRGGDPSEDIFYAIAANDVSRTVPLLKDHASDTQWLKEQALPVAYKITKDHNIADVTSEITITANNIPANPVDGGTYNVTFSVAGVPVTVVFAAYGTAPDINFEVGTTAYNSGSPLVIQQTPGAPHLLTDAELKQKMTVADAEDLDSADLLANHTTVEINGVSSATAKIDTQVVAVYSVKYTVTDSDGMWVSATRAIVVTDRRYVIDKNEGLILGAINFVKKSIQVDGTPNEVLNSSFTRAYREDGTSIPDTNLSVANWPVPGYVSGAAPDTYEFTLAVQGYTLTKNIKGIVTGADEVFPGYGNDQYAIAASHFQKNIAEAEDMRDSGNLAGAEAFAADVTIYKLVDDAAESYVYVVTDDSFPGGPPVVQKPNSTDPNPFSITFGIKRQTDGSEVVTSPLSRVTINARISQGNNPVLSVTTPINVPLGGAFAPWEGVALSDAEDNPLTPQDTTLTPSAGGVDSNAPGLYPMVYSYTDTDNNPTPLESGQRVAVVNDGHYAISNDANLENGRILYASAFVVKSSAVEPDPLLRDAQIKSLAGVALYNGKTGGQVNASDLVAVLNSSNYGPTAANYNNIILQATDAPQGTFTKNISAKVVDADVLVPTVRNQFGSTTYVYGSNVASVSVSEAENIAGGGISRIKTELKAGAAKLMPEGTISDPGVTITDQDNFLTRLTDSSLTNDLGTYSFTVADAENGLTSTVLTITVSSGPIPVLSMNKPLELSMPAAAGNLTRDQIMSDVTVTDADETIPLSAVTYSIADADGNPLTDIDGTVPGLYKVTYNVSDSDHQAAVPVSRAIVINDGRFKCEGNHVLSALSFIINRTQVSSAAYAQIRTESGARAWDSNGDPATAEVVSSGYTNTAGTYPTRIGVQGQTLEKNITVVVVKDDNSNTGISGAHIEDGNSDNGDRYAIYAHNFRINVVDAKALAAETPTAFAADLITRAGASSYDRTTENLSGGGTAAYVSDGGFRAAAATLAEGDKFTITFKVAEDDNAVVAITAFVSNAAAPVISAPDSRTIWIGDPNDPEKPADAVLPNQFHYINTGPVYANDDIDSYASINASLKYGTATYSGSTVVNFVEGSPVNMSKVGFYPVTYMTTDSDHNTTYKTVIVVVTDGSIIVPPGSAFGIKAYDFVETLDRVKANGSTADQIVAQSRVEIYRVTPAFAGEDIPVLVTGLTASELVENQNGFDGAPALDKATIPVAGVTYSNIELGYDGSVMIGGTLFEGHPQLNIDAKVIDRDVIANDVNAADSNDTARYVIAANNIILPYNQAASYGGLLTDIKRTMLIDATKAVAYRLTAATASHGVTVVDSTIPAAPIAGAEYKVSFSPTNVPGIVIEVNVHVNFGGTPVITFQQDPREVPQVSVSIPIQDRYMTENELKDFMAITDVEDDGVMLLRDRTQVYVPGANPDVLPLIDKYAVGVYPVEYTVTDLQGNTDTKIRAVVVNDGRFEIIDENGDGKKDIIIGARDFVLLAKDSNGYLGQVISASKVNIYDRQGTRLEPILRDGIPAEYISKVIDKAHPFIWTAAGHTASKEITGTLVNADEIYPGDDNDQYSIVANHFSRNTTDAAAMIATGDLNAALIAAADVRVFKLVDSASEALPRVVSNGNFSAAPNSPGYQIYFGAKTTANPAVDVPAPPTRILVLGEVSDFNKPVIEASTPLEVWIGDSASPLRSPTSILSIDYDDKYHVTASDIEDIDLDVDDVVVTHVSPTTDVDLTVPGLYVLKYDVTDSDHNPAVPRSRVVVVNDGTILPGQQRLLYGTSFVTLSKDVTGNLNNLILSLSRAWVYDAETGADHGRSGITVPFNDGFSATPDDYRITLSVTDGTTGTALDKDNIIGRVVRGTVIRPSAPNPTGPTTYVYGTNLELTRADAMTIADGGVPKLKTELLAAASKVLPDGNIDDIDVNITDTDNFIARLQSPNNNLADDVGIFNFIVTDVENQTSIDLTINVSIGEPPLLTVAPKPYSIPMKAQGSPVLTRAEIMYGVTATDKDAETSQNPTGDITNTVTYEVKNDSGMVITGAVPSDVAAVYQVTYTVIDADFNPKVETRALIVNDKSFIYNTEYILSARHFVVGASEVNTFDLSGDILIRSNARAWSSQTGIPAIAEVEDPRGYSATPGSYSPNIQVAGHPALNKSIDALVINDGDGGDPDPGDGNGGNGNQYSITANNFRLNAIDAEALAATSAQNIAADFLLKSGAHSYDRTATNGLVSTGTPELSDDGGFKAAAGTFQDGDLFKVTFWVSEDHSATTDAWVIISRGAAPQIQAPALRTIWIGDPNDPRRQSDWVAPGDFHYINTGPVTVTDDYDGSTIAASLKYGTATYSGSDVLDFQEGTPVNMSVVAFYPVTYTATDSDYNTTYETVLVLVTDGSIIPPGPGESFAIKAYDFVETLDNVKANGDTAEQIVAKSRVEIYRVMPASVGEPIPVLVTGINASEIVEDQKGFDGAPALDPTVSGALPATYTGIELGYDKNSTPLVINGKEFKGYPRIQIDAKVIDKDVIDDQTDPSANARYIVAANNVTLFPLDALNYRGLGDQAKANLITAALAEGYVITGNGTVGGLGTAYVDVLSNEMGEGSIPAAGSTYKVVFYPKSVPNAQNPAARIEVDFIISNGNFPVIRFNKIPLVVNQGAVLDPKAEMTVTDIEDDASGYATLLDVQLFDENGNALASIDTSTIGVYKARYTATDHETNKTIEERAIVVTDGRYVIPDADNDGKIDDNNVIIGARNFVIKQAAVMRDLDTVRGLAYAEAFDKTGTKLSGQPVLEGPDGGFPPGYVTATAAYGDYDFTWVVPGYLTEKKITGIVLDAGVIDPGPKDSQYAIAASPFQRNQEDARDIINGLNSNGDYVGSNEAFRLAANAQVIKLVDGVADKAVVVPDRGGFTIPQGAILPPAGLHTIVYGIDGIPTTVQKAPIIGTISNLNPPELTASTPLEVWVGDAGLKPAGAIDPADYDIRYDVTLTDIEDTAVTAADALAVYNGPAVPEVIDRSAVGTYQIHYSFTDSDNNPADADRTVVVNDGRYVLGENRALLANPFVIKRSEVVTNVGVVDQHLLLNTQAKLYDGETGVEITGDQLFIAGRGTPSYSNAVGVYDITVAGKDFPATNPDISKTVKAEVVDAEVFESGPNDPNQPNYYIFGNNLPLTPAEAQDIVDAADSTAALLEALKAGSRVTRPDGSLDTLAVVIDPAGDGDEFLANTYLANNVIYNTGTYHVLITDAEGHISTTLEVSVVSGNAPVITAVPSPLVIPIAPVGSGFLTEAQLMTGVSATDIEDDAAQLPLVISIVGGVPSIAADVFSVTPLVYTVTDSAGNTKTVRRAVIVNDDSIGIGTNYIISANSFVIGSSMVGYDDVAGQKVPIGIEEQILKESNATAWRITGEVVTGMAVGVVSTGNYRSDVGRYPIKVAAAGETTLTREIAAVVFNDDTTEGTNGDQYSITADHFRVNVRDADLLVTKTADEIAADFLYRAGVKSYKRSGALNSTTDGTRIMTTDGGFKAHGPFALTDQGTTFQVTFQVSEDPTAFQTVTCLVSNALPPTLTVPAMKESPLNVPISDAFYRNGVEAIDALDGILTSSVEYDASAVDITQGGKYYPVHYWVEDRDNNTAEATGFVFINDGTWEFDGDYAVRAYDFVTTAANVTAAGTDTNTLTLALSHAEARLAVKTVDPDGFITSVDLVPVTPVVKTGSVALGTAVGTYSPIKIGVEAQAPYVGNPIRDISATVIDKDVISNKPEVDDNGTPTDPSDDVILTPPDGNDQNPNDPSDSARYIVGANDVTIRYYEVANFVGLDPIVKARLISAAAAEAFKITSASAPFDVDVTVNDIAATADAGDSFYVTFIVKGIPSVYAKAKFSVIRGNAPALNVGDPLVVPASEATALLNESVLRQGISASDVEDGILTSRIVVTEPGTNHLPTIDTSVPGVYSVLYTVTDDDGLSTNATRPVIIDDGRYELIDENRDGSIDIIIGAKNFVVKQSNCLGTVGQAKELSYVEAYSSAGADLIAQVELVSGDLPQGYIDREQGVYKLTWTINGHPAVAIDVNGSIIADDYIVTPIDKTSAYAIIAKDFALNTQMAATINTDAHYISYANAAVIKLVESGIDRQVALVNNDNFKAVQGTYRITFGAGGIATSKLSSTITATVTNGSAPLLATDSPIIIRMGPAGTPVIDLAQILRAGHITIIDSEAVDPVSNPTGDITSSALLIDSATGQVPSIAADQPGVHQVTIKVVDADGNPAERSVAVVVDDGNFVYTTPKADGSGFILRAHGFDIDLRDVANSQAIDQIREQSETQAWRNDGAQVVAAIIDTGGYKDAPGTYNPVVGVYDTTGALTIIPTPDLSKPIQVNVVDTYVRNRVTFDGNGGVLVGPRVITVVEPQTTLPYLPASPIRDGYTFRYWSTSGSGGAQFTADTPLIGDITLYAIWTQNPTTPTPTPTPPPTVIVNNPPVTVGGGTTNVTVEPEAQTGSTDIPAAQTPQSSGEDIEDTIPPLVPFEPTTGWALFDLLATIFALLLLVVFFIKFFFDRPRDEEYEEEPIDAQLWEAMTPDQRAQYQARREADYQTWQADQQRKANRQKALYVNAPVVLIIGIAFIEALLVLLNTQNFELNMSIVGTYSVIFALILFVQLLTPMVAAIIHNNRRENQKMGPTQPVVEDGGVTL